MAAMLRHNYLSERMLTGLSAYKYAASGHTWLDRLHDPMWDAAVQRLPLWLAPNLITFTGTMFMILAHWLLFLYAPDLDGAAAPAWVHWFAFFAVLIYVNLDCMDGKQARRTNSSSPLGQLFDHGCDALVTGVLMVNVASSVGMQLSPRMALMLFAPLALWILGQWEEYHTGHMKYGNGYFGVLEANYALASCHLVSALFGAAIWHLPLRDIFGRLVPAAVADVPAVMALFWLAVGFIGVQMLVQTYRVFAVEHTMTAGERGHKELGPLNATKHLLYIVLFFALAYLFLMQPWQADGQMKQRAMLEVVVLCYATIATQVIMAHMAKEAYVPAKAPYVALALGVLNHVTRALPEVWFLYCLCAVVLVAYVHYIANVVLQICEHLGISCFRLPKYEGRD